MSSDPPSSIPGVKPPRPEIVKADLSVQAREDQRIARGLASLTQDGIDEFVARFGSGVRSILARHGVDGPDLDDAVVELIFHVALKMNKGLWRDDLPFRPWFYRIVKNFAYSYHRGQRRRRDVIDSLAGIHIVSTDDETGRHHAERREMHRIMRVRISRVLRGRSQRVLLEDLDAGGECSTSGLASKLGTSAGAIRMARSRGRKLLQKDAILRRLFRQHVLGEDE